MMCILQNYEYEKYLTFAGTTFRKGKETKHIKLRRIIRSYAGRGYVEGFG
jgi:hypothetical protein